MLELSEITVTKTTDIRTRYNLTTEDIEQIIKEHFKFKGEITFNWNIGQWVDLSITTVETEIINVLE